ncbi:hypothetical protein BS17DRAFT_450298 [Gyrodon lividus]|nr:hypothetical protein BS17DRAFT_450298 [Gyrodon lividus]
MHVVHDHFLYYSSLSIHIGTRTTLLSAGINLGVVTNSEISGSSEGHMLQVWLQALRDLWKYAPHLILTMCTERNLLPHQKFPTRCFPWFPRSDYYSRTNSIARARIRLAALYPPLGRSVYSSDRFSHPSSSAEGLCPHSSATIWKPSLARSSGFPCFALTPLGSCVDHSRPV